MVNLPERPRRRGPNGESPDMLPGLIGLSDSQSSLRLGATSSIFERIRSFDGGWPGSHYAAGATARV